ncbi:MAG: hypothetical protein NTU73_13065 [Ignavibacteriae bacterium]|nr:hypothetical protein [Ignavibacteriota bacterium]
MEKYLIVVLSFILLSSGIKAQNENRNKAIFIEPKSEFYEEMTKEINRFNTPEKEENKAFKVDFTGMDLPKSMAEFKYFWHNRTVSQGQTGTCWAFSTTSYFESEINRINKKEIKLSEMYTVYWEYVEKARRFIRERGNSAFAEGSEANAVPRIWKK